MDQVEKTKDTHLDTLYKGFENLIGKTRIKRKAFTYTWVIENFEGLDDYDGILSHCFNVYIDNNRYTLQLKMSTYENNFDVYLERREMSLKKYHNKYVNVKLSIIDGTDNQANSNGQFNINIAKNDSSLCHFPFEMKSSNNRGVLQLLINGNLKLRFTMYFTEEVQSQLMSYEDSENISTTSKMSISQHLDSLLTSPKFSDVVLVVGDQKFEAHKAILARSPVFSAMFDNPMKESQTNVVEIGEMKPEIMLELLRFIYTGQVNGIEAVAADLLVVAEMHHLDILKTMCEQALIKTLNLENLGDVLKIVDLHSTCHRLRKFALEFLMCHGKKVRSLQNLDNILEQLSPALLKEITKASLNK